MSVKSSQREMEAVTAERDSIKFKQVEYLMNKIGETFSGVITGVTDWGIYVQEESCLADGMVRLASIKSDYFEHEASKYRIKGQKTGMVYQLGDRVTVKLINADKGSQATILNLLLLNVDIQSKPRRLRRRVLIISFKNIRLIVCSLFYKFPEFYLNK